MSSENNSPIIACNPGAIDPAQRDSHANLAQEIFSAATILQIKELADGYGFQLPIQTPLLYKVVQFVANERLCCPFFTFTLVVGEEFWLQLTGTPDVKGVIEAEILPIIQTAIFPTMDELQVVYDAALGN